MNTQINWTQEQEAMVSETAMTQLSESRVAARVLPELTLADSERVVTAFVVNGSLRTVDDTNSIPLAEISVEFELVRQQMVDPDLKAAIALARRSATIFGWIEDALMFYGQPGQNLPPPLPGLPPPRIAVNGGGTVPGLIPAFGPQGLNFKWIGNMGAVVDAVALGMSILESEGHLGPFALVLSPLLWQVAHTPSPALVLPRDRIEPMIGGTIHRSGVLRGRSGILLSLGGDPIQRVVATDASVEFVDINPVTNGYVWRVTGHRTIRIKEREAAVVIHYF